MPCHKLERLPVYQRYVLSHSFKVLRYRWRAYCETG